MTTKPTTFPRLAESLLTRHEAADVLRVSVRTLDRLTKDGLVPAVRIGCGAKQARYRTRYRLKDIERIIAALLRKDKE